MKTNGKKKKSSESMNKDRKYLKVFLVCLYTFRRAHPNFVSRTTNQRLLSPRVSARISLPSTQREKQVLAGKIKIMKRNSTV
jgi:hypothetical protein